MSNYMTQANAIADALRGRGAAPVPRRRRGPSAAPSAANLQVLTFMREFFANNDQLPPVAVVAKHFGWAAGTADWHIQALIHHGLLQRNVLGKLKFARRAQQ
jgi:hypothetical protein